MYVVMPTGVPAASSTVKGSMEPAAWSDKPSFDFTPHGFRRGHGGVPETPQLAVADGLSERWDVIG